MAKAVAKIEDDDLSPEEVACLPRERAFIHAFLETNNAAKAAEMAGAECSASNEFARVGYRYLQRERVQKAMAVIAIKQIRNLAPRAVNAYKELVDNNLQPAVRFKTATSILERLSPSVAKVDVTHTHKFDPIKITLEFLASLKKQGWSREQLLTEFTPFELDHFEKLLASGDVIDADFEEIRQVKEPDFGDW